MQITKQHSGAEHAKQQTVCRLLTNKQHDVLHNMSSYEDTLISYWTWFSLIGNYAQRIAFWCESYCKVKESDKNAFCKCRNFPEPLLSFKMTQCDGRLLAGWLSAQLSSISGSNVAHFRFKTLARNVEVDRAACTSLILGICPFCRL